MEESSTNPPPSVIIKGIGAYAPTNVVTNDDLAKRVDTSDEWITSRTGIKQRCIARDDENCSDLAAEAAKIAIADAGLAVEDIDLVIVGTITPDMPFPSTACLVQAKLGIRQVPCFDVEAACSGFLYVLDIANNMLRSGNYRNALVIGAEKLSSIIDWEDRTTCVLFGDGAGAVVLSPSEEPGYGILGTRMGADGTESQILYMPGGGSQIPASEQSIKDRMHFLKMAGREVFKVAVRVMEQSALQTLERHGVKPEEVSCIIPHQANFRIIDALASRTGLPIEKFLVNLDRYGNTSAASIPIALKEAQTKFEFKKGDYILMVAFGAGLTWAASLIKWH